MCFCSPFLLCWYLGGKPAKGPEYLGQWKETFDASCASRCWPAHPRLLPWAQVPLPPLPSLENDCWFSLEMLAKFLSQFAQLPSKIIHGIFKFWQEASTVSSAIILTPESLENQDQRRQMQVDLCSSSCIFHSAQSLSILGLLSLTEGASLSAPGLGCVLAVPVIPTLYFILLRVTLEAETVPDT